MNPFALSFPSLSPAPQPKNAPLKPSSIRTSRFHTRHGAKPSISDFLHDEVQSDHSEPSGDEAKTIPLDHINAHFDPRRSRHKVKSRLARPRDALPNFKRKRHYRGSSTARFKQSGPTIGKGYLDRGVSKEVYYGGHGDGALGEKETSEAEEEAVESVVPLCSGHGMKAKLFTCKKGANKGRKFYKCGIAVRYRQCEYFCWEEEVGIGIACGGLGVEGGEARVAVATVEGEVDEIIEGFGWEGLKEGQGELLRKLKEGDSCLGVMLEGKMGVYEVFAAGCEGVVVVVVNEGGKMFERTGKLGGGLKGMGLRIETPPEVCRAVERKVRRGEVKVLFVVAEMLFGEWFQAVMKGVKVGLVVVEEAQCVFEGGGEFRGEYGRVSRSLVEEDMFDGEFPVLAVAAVATPETVTGICDALKMEKENVVVGRGVKGGGLKMSLSSIEGGLEGKAAELVRRLGVEPVSGLLGVVECKKEKMRVEVEQWGTERPKKRRRTGARNQDVAEIEEEGSEGSGEQRTKLKKGPSRSGRRSSYVVVYVGKQRDCESVCNYLRSSKLNMANRVVAYHGGMPPKERTAVESRVAKGAISIIVSVSGSNINCGMPRVCGVIHFNMPPSLERYVREVGLARHEGREAICHVFYNRVDGNKALSHCQARRVDRNDVREFLRMLVGNPFQRKPSDKEKCMEEQGAQGKSESEDNSDEDGHRVARVQVDKRVILSVKESELGDALNISHETANMMCVVLESSLDDVRLIQRSHSKVRICFYSESPQQLLESKSEVLHAADKDILTVISSLATRSAESYHLCLNESRMLEEDVIDSLRRLQNNRYISFELLDRGIYMECGHDGFSKLKSRKEIFAETVHNRLKRIVDVQMRKTSTAIEFFAKADSMLSDGEQSAYLNTALIDYFSEHPKPPEQMLQPVYELDKEAESSLRKAIRDVFAESRYGSKNPSRGRHVALILHGISSVGFHAKQWYKCQHWGKWAHVDFGATVRIAREVKNHQTRKRVQET